jgi:hypothetical protein
MPRRQGQQLRRESGTCRRQQGRTSERLMLSSSCTSSSRLMVCLTRANSERLHLMAPAAGGPYVQRVSAAAAAAEPVAAAGAAGELPAQCVVCSAPATGGWLRETGGHSLCR